jgi:hypothetical protein
MQALLCAINAAKIYSTLTSVCVTKFLPVVLIFISQLVFFLVYCKRPWGKIFLYVDNPLSGGEKKCRKKNFFDSDFAAYFAILTAGNIPIIIT